LWVVFGLQGTFTMAGLPFDIDPRDPRSVTAPPRVARGRSRRGHPDAWPVPPERSVRPSRRAPRGVSVAWLLLILVVGGGGVSGAYGFERWQTAEEALRAVRGEVAQANERAAVAEQRSIEAVASATREQEAKAKLESELVGASERAAEADALADRLQALVGEQGTVVREDDKLTLEMVDRVLFASGEAVLTPRGEAVLSAVGGELKRLPDKQVWVQGHTDDVPITNANFASNWELSTARALTVVHYLQNVSGVDPRRLAAVGFGEHRPVSRAKRFRNRRIEIVLFPREVTLIKE
jgi:chemotaxis protein MotB